MPSLIRLSPSTIEMIRCGTPRLAARSRSRPRDRWGRRSRRGRTRAPSRSPARSARPRDADHRRQDEPDREQRDRADVPPKLAKRREERGRVQERRQQDEQHQIRLELDLGRVRHEAQRRASDREQDRIRDAKELGRDQQRDHHARTRVSATSRCTQASRAASKAASASVPRTANTTRSSPLPPARWRRDLGDLDRGGLLDRESADAGAERDQGQRPAAELVGDLERRRGRGADDLGRRRPAEVHRRRMDHPTARQVARARRDRGAELDRRERIGLVLDRAAAGARRSPPRRRRRGRGRCSPRWRSRPPRAG